MSGIDYDVERLAQVLPVSIMAALAGLAAALDDAEMAGSVNIHLHRTLSMGDALIVRGSESRRVRYWPTTTSGVVVIGRDPDQTNIPSEEQD